jgi:hypothetical protein
MEGMFKYAWGPEVAVTVTPGGSGHAVAKADAGGRLTTLAWPTGPCAPAYDPEAVRAKYLAERDKRLVPGRADIRDLRTDEHFARYRDDPFTPVVERDPVVDEVDVVIVGGGIAGVLAGAQLRKAGVERIRIIDQAGGIGGTWYWNRYPGVMCDVESYIYIPMLEELDYIPTRRYAFGEEIRGHLEAIADRFDLDDDALFHTGVTAPSGTRTRPGGGSAPTAATRSAAAGTCWPSGS